MTPVGDCFRSKDSSEGAGGSVPHCTRVLKLLPEWMSQREDLLLGVIDENTKNGYCSFNLVKDTM